MKNTRIMSLEKEFVPYQESLELKKLGFDEPCFGYRHDSNQFTFFVDVRNCNTNTEFEFYPTAPTFSQAFRFFRENYKLQTYIDYYHSDSYFYKIKSQDGRNIGNTGDVILQGSPVFTRVYEEAELACLRKLIEITKEKQHDVQTN